MKHILKIKPAKIGQNYKIDKNQKGTYQITAACLKTFSR